MKTLESGVPSSKEYVEPYQRRKRRAFIRAVEHAGVVASELHSEVEIEGVGHLHSSDRTIGLRVPSRGQSIDGLVIGVIIPPHGTRANIELGERDADNATIMWRDSAGTSYDIAAPVPDRGYCWLQFKEPLDADSARPRNFEVNEGADNSIAMTNWELAEKSRLNRALVNRDHEEVGYYLGYPVDKFVIRVTMPTTLEGITPELRCYRHPKYPDFARTFRPDERTLSFDLSKFPVDHELQTEEANRLRFDASSCTWILCPRSSDGGTCLQPPLEGAEHNCRRQKHRTDDRVSDSVTEVASADQEGFNVGD